MSLLQHHVPVLPELQGAYGAFASWMIAWRDKKWAAMAKASQLTWRSASPSACEGMLDAWYGLKDLHVVHVEKLTPISDCTVDITAVLDYTIGEPGHVRKRATVRVICEVGVRKPSPDGMWGVNPLSAMREEPA